MTENATSPASSGPAGSHFEGQVGAYYLLAMLTGSEPRGLPGTAIDRVEFQRAAEGHPLDDVIIHAHDMTGNPAVIEIQVKRSIAFSPADPLFRAVVGQIVEASRRQDFWTSRYELAIATARTSRKIDGAYQDVLTWARQIGDATTFMARIDRPGSANSDMRTFVQTFKSHLQDAESPYDEETVWRLLRKLQILVFDFTAQGSATEELTKERAVRALHPDDALRAVNFWTTLVELALQIAKSGGDRTRNSLSQDLARQTFRLAGVRHHSSVRTILAEASRNALSDIDDRVGDVMLTRVEHIAAVHAALDNGHYLEIRGDAGVGKSAILKHVAEQTAAEARVIVLSHGRTTPGGWMAMRAMLGFDGTARDLLTELACDGGAILFVDNLDFFSNEERRTAIDLVRAAASVPGVAVVVTARRNFAVEEPHWLPPDALALLGQAEPVVIGELSQSEVEEMRSAAPRLAPLLADTHPARDVTRNLFRLARLASRPGGEPVPRTEIEMAEQWWRTADGGFDGDHRERTRLLKVLAEQALESTGPMDVSDYSAGAINALVASETLRDLGVDRVTFRHDVLREWAIANLLDFEPVMFERLPLYGPAPAALARGIELTARMALERSPDGISWLSLIERLSREGIHGSWRRAALLGLVRSEIGINLLGRVSSILLSDRARMLRELIRIVMAVEVEPASRVFASFGIDPAAIPTSLNIPIGPAWSRLILWLLSLGQGLPVAAIPDVVDLYFTWSSGMLGRDPLTPLLMQSLYRWLTEIEVARDFDSFRDDREPFGGEIDHERIRSLESDIRTGFLMFCNRTPDLAVDYLRSIGQRQHNENTVRSILKFRGSLAQAAPAELADLTVATLIPKHQPDERDNGHHFEKQFGFIDNEFLPASPAQGPFFDLLTHAPQLGLSLIHKLSDHAISFYSRGREYGDDAITIPFFDCEKTFPWMRSYAWSREGAGPYCLTSALMALEAWAHRRIEAGETFDCVLADVLGPPGSPAAYLLIAVDLLLSHWPASLEFAVPFLASPELLCIDRERHVHDNFKYPDIFGFEAFQKEPVGATSLESLKNRASRRLMLDQLLGQCAVFGPIKLRKLLTVQLRSAAARLGPPDANSDLGDPAFMVVHALNLVDPSNWREVTFMQGDGTQQTAHEYVVPEDESRHLKALQEASHDRLTDTNIQAAISLGLEDPSRSSPAFAAAAIEWAQRAALKPKNEDADTDWIREQAIITAATIAMRDSAPELRDLHSKWARSIFAQAFKTREDPVHRFRSGLRYNPIAIAFVGLIHSITDRVTTDDMRTLLDVVASGNPAAAHGFGAAAVTIASIDERLPRAMLRCAFAALIRQRREWDLAKEEVATRFERYRQWVEAAVSAELAWLADDRPEPDWPVFPSEAARIRVRTRFRLIGGKWQPDMPAPQPPRQVKYADHQGAALWLSNARSIVDAIKRPWLRDIVHTYASWTFEINGAGQDTDDEIENAPREWNDAFFDLMANCLPSLAMSEIDKIALASINSLPDTPFFDTLTPFLRGVDSVYFIDGGLQESIAISIRSALVKRMMASSGWKRVGGSRSASIERRIAPAIAVLFFNDYGFIQPTKCYLLPKGIDRIASFLPVLEKLVESGPSHYVATLILNLLEVSPKPAHLPYIISAVKTWLKSFPENSAFWVDHGFGQRVCGLIQGIWRQEQALSDPKEAARTDLDRMLAALISLGVADARRLEEILARG